MLVTDNPILYDVQQMAMNHFQQRKFSKWREFRILRIAIRGASVFSSQLRSALYAAKALDRKRVFVGAHIQEDLLFWSEFANCWNGREVIHSQPALPKGHLSADAMCDASDSAIGLFAFGRAWRIEVDRGLWNSGAFPTASTDIAILELIAFALLVASAAALFPDALQELLLAGASNNSTVLHRVQNGYASLQSANAEQANGILRFIWKLTAFARHSFRLHWIRSEDNTLSDAPTRTDAAAFAKSVDVYNTKQQKINSDLKRKFLVKGGRRLQV